MAESRPWSVVKRELEEQRDFLLRRLQANTYELVQAQLRQSPDYHALRRRVDEDTRRITEIRAYLRQMESGDAMDTTDFGAQQLAQYGQNTASLDDVVDGIQNMRIEPDHWQEQYAQADAAAAASSAQKPTKGNNALDFSPSVMRDDDEEDRVIIAIRETERQAASATSALTPTRERGVRDLLTYAGPRRLDANREAEEQKRFPDESVESTFAFIRDENSRRLLPRPTVTQAIVDQFRVMFAHGVQQAARVKSTWSQNLSADVEREIRAATTKTKRDQLVAKWTAEATKCREDAARCRNFLLEIGPMVANYERQGPVGTIQREAEAKGDEETIRENTRRSEVVALGEGLIAMYSEAGVFLDIKAGMIREGIQRATPAVSGPVLGLSPALSIPPLSSFGPSSAPEEKSEREEKHEQQSSGQPVSAVDRDAFSAALRALDGQRLEYEYLVSRGAEQNELDECVLGFETLREELADTLENESHRNVILSQHIDADGTLERRAHERLGV
jgi:hypothetical protein